MIVGAIGPNGWVQGAQICFVANSADDPEPEDYHKNFDGTRFENWFKMLLDLVPRGTVIVCDNASYHSTIVSLIL